MHGKLHAIISRDNLMKAARKERWEMAGALRDEGLTFRAIGEHLGVGPEQARQLYNRCRRVRLYAEMERNGALPHIRRAPAPPG